MDRRPGCLAGLFQLTLLNWVFDFLQHRFGFGRGPAGCGCGVILVILAILMTCSICGGTNWFRLF